MNANHPVSHSFGYQFEHLYIVLIEVYGDPSVLMVVTMARDVVS